MSLVSDILHFWFGAPGSPGCGQFRDAWFRKDPDFDDQIRRNFLDATVAAARGEHDRLQADRDGALALVILLDQFPRNLFRGEPRAFAADPKARAVADAAISRGFDRDRPTCERLFFYLPFEHSEALADQDRSVALFRQLAGSEPWIDQGIEAALRHHEIIQRFGRFPHRNIVLGRESTEAEIAFLKEPRSSF
jgi:uncharacterized protein (DUF924 family)